MLGDMLGHMFRATPAARRAATSESLAFWKQIWTSQGAPRQGPATLARALSSSSRTAAKRPLLRQVLWKPSNFGRTARAQTRGFRFSAWRGNAQAGGGAEESLSLSQRLKKLSREYGWSAVGVYFALSVLDFPFCFLLVRIVGTDRIGKWALGDLLSGALADALYSRAGALGRVQRVPVHSRLGQGQMGGVPSLLQEGRGGAHGRRQDQRGGRESWLGCGGGSAAQQLGS